MLWMKKAIKKLYSRFICWSRGAHRWEFQRHEFGVCSYTNKVCLRCGTKIHLGYVYHSPTTPST